MDKKLLLVRSCLLALGALTACGDSPSEDGSEQTRDPSEVADSGTKADPDDGNSNGGENGPSGNTQGSGEDTDDGDATGGDTDAGSEVAGTVNFRVDSLVVSSPSIYVLNNTPNAVDVKGAVNLVVKQGVKGDIFPFKMPDGIVDISTFMRFPEGLPESGTASVGGGVCKAPLSDAACTPDPKAPFFDITYSYISTGTCLESGAVSLAAPCYKSDKRALSVALAALGAVPLTGVEVAAQLSSDGKSVTKALIRGFLTKANADVMKVPADLPKALTLLGVTSGAPLSSMLSDADQDTLDGETGWWFTATATAVEHAYDDTAAP